MKTYIVTAALKFAGYSNHGRHTGYEVTVHAKNKADAIKAARPRVRDMGWDRHEGPLTYTAREEV